MNILKRSLAPVTEEAWNEIDEFATDVIKSQLTGRKVVDVKGPLGWDHSAEPLGRVEVPSGQSNDDVQYGVRMVKPLIETRVPFELDIWELDNISRGAKDVNLDPMEEAAKKAAQFEENAIYRGLSLGSISGMLEENVFSLSMNKENNISSYLGLFAQAVDYMKNASIDGPYSLVVPLNQWKKIVDSSTGYPAERRIKDLLGGDVMLNQYLDNAVVVSQRGGDLALTLGMDFAIGYALNTEKSVRFTIMESFTFQIFEPRSFVVCEL